MSKCGPAKNHLKGKTMSIDLSLAFVPRSSTGLIMPKEVLFYYLRTLAGRPVGCVCFGRGKTWFCRGIAICSDLDNFSRKTARELAYRRFLMAVHDRKPAGKVGRDWVLEMLGSANIMEKDCYHSAYKVEPTRHEEHLWDKLIEKETKCP